MSNKEFVDNLWVVEYSIEKDQLTCSRLEDILQRNRKLAFDRSSDVFIPLAVLPTEQLAEQMIPKLRESMKDIHFMSDTIDQALDDASRLDNGH